MLKELKTVLSIWLVVAIPTVILTTLHEDIAAAIWVAFASVIGGVYAGLKDTRSRK